LDGLTAQPARLNYHFRTTTDLGRKNNGEAQTLGVLWEMAVIGAQHRLEWQFAGLEHVSVMMEF